MSAASAIAASPAVAGPRRLPSVFVSHGGGPVPVLPAALFPPLFQWMADGGKASQSLKGLLAQLGVKKEELKAVLVISAHWEESVTTVANGASTRLLYDYHGFPPESYKIAYPAPGAPEAAGLALRLLKEAGIAARSDAFRPLDHGSFIPLKLILPDADVPVFQVSLTNRMADVATHMRVGAALAPLRDQGVLIIGSGFMTHNLGDLRMGSASSEVDPRYKAFTDHVEDVLTNPKHSLQDRCNALLNIAKTAPNFRLAHPREEHLMPLLVAAAAAVPEVGPALGSTESPAAKAFMAATASVAATAASGAAAGESAAIAADGTATTEAASAATKPSSSASSPFKATKLVEIWGGGNMGFINWRFD